MRHEVPRRKKEKGGNLYHVTRSMCTAWPGDGSEQLPETEVQSTVTNSKIKISAVEGDLTMENYLSKRSAPLQENPPERKQAKLSGREKRTFVSKWKDYEMFERALISLDF